MSQYRDDLEAAHERIRALEREVEDLRGPEAEDAPPPPADPAVRAGSGRGGAALVALGALMLVGLVGVALVTRRPAVFVLVPPCLCFFVVMILLGRLVHVIRPNELLVLAGRDRRLADGSTVGFRLARGGRVIALPFLERAFQMDLRPRCLDWTVRGAYTRGGVAVTASGYLLVAVDPDRAAAVERFLDRDGEELEEVARETLEGCLRSVLANETVDDIVSDPAAFSMACTMEAEPEFQKLGLQLLNHHLLRIRPEQGRGGS